MTARPKDKKEEITGMFQPLDEKDENARKIYVRDKPESCVKTMS